MSYFIVPSISYQTNQKLQQQKQQKQKDKDKHHKRKKKPSQSNSSSSNEENQRNLSTTTPTSRSRQQLDTIIDEEINEEYENDEDEDDNKSIITTNSIFSKHKSDKRNSHKSNSHSSLRRKLQPHHHHHQQHGISPTTSPSVSEEPPPPPCREDINKEATMIASKYGEALRSGSKLSSTKSVLTSDNSPNVTGLIIPPPQPVTKNLVRHRSNSTLSTSSIPLSSSPSQSQYNQNQAFHRNTSIASSLSQNSQNSLTKDNSSLNGKFRKLSFLSTGNNSITSKRKESISSHLPGAAESPTGTGTGTGPTTRSRSRSGSKVDGSYFPDYSDKTTSPSKLTLQKQLSSSSSSSSLLLPPFNVIIDLSVYNTPQGIEKNFFAPNYQVFRYNSFLDVLSEYHQGDAINVSTIRYHLLLKFIIKQKNARDFIRNGNSINTSSSYHLTMTESVFSYQLYGPLRYLIRYLIKQKFQEQNHNNSMLPDNREQFYNHEELIQMNFINFIRYIMQLPDIPDPSILNETEQKIYEFKEIFEKTATALYVLKKDKLLQPTTTTTTTTTTETSVESKDESFQQQDSQVRIKLLVETITKICYEYILLEKYRLDIISKFHDNHLIDKDILNDLYDKYENNVKLKNSENVKVFLYNTSNLIQFGWYFALTIPFVRVIESHVYNEDPHLTKDYQTYQEAEISTTTSTTATTTPKTNFQQSDEELFENHIKKLSFTSYNEYKSLSMEKLVRLNRIIDNQSNKYSKINRREIPDPASNFSTKPMNFEYYNQSMLTIESNTFDMIHTPDLIIQTTPQNYKTLISEFHRILKPGGILNLDCVNFGGNNFEDFSLKYKEKGQFPKILNTEDYGICKHFNSISNFLEVILKELNNVFKESEDDDGGSVKFGISLLSSKLDLHSFATKFVSMRLLEVLGKFDSYCDYFLDAGDNIKALDDESIHFGIQIRATKGRTAST